MRNITRSNGPSWEPKAVLSKAGWMDPKSGKIFVPMYKLIENEKIDKVQPTEPVYTQPQDRITISSKRKKKKKLKSEEDTSGAVVEPSIISAVQNSFEPIDKMSDPEELLGV